MDVNSTEWASHVSLIYSLEFEFVNFFEWELGQIQSKLEQLGNISDKEPFNVGWKALEVSAFD